MLVTSRPIVVCAALIVSASTTDAHLSLIRQGLDSNGALEAGDRSGWALAVGDFNSDGFDDLAIGAPYDDVTVSAIERLDAGAVTIVYGSRNGLTQLGAQVCTASSIGQTSTADARFGAALAAGDFNGDLYDDLAIGAPFETVGQATLAGRVYILHGGANGLASTAARTILQSDVAGVVVEPGDEFGAAMAAGNMNGDDITPHDDLAIGSPGEDTDAGAAFFFPGSDTGLSNAGAFWFRQSNIGSTNEAVSRFGEALAVGNLCGDLAEDLVVAAPNRDAGLAQDAGRFYLLFGTGFGPATASAIAYDGNQAFGHSGAALAIGRFKDSTDNLLSLAIGEPGFDFNGMPGSGRVVMSAGTPAGLTWPAGDSVNQELAGKPSEPQDKFGSALAAGDWDADGYDDVAVGAWAQDVVNPYSPINQLDAGEAFLFRGGFTGLSGSQSRAFNQDVLNDFSVIDDRFAFSLAMGVFDNSGRANIAAGVPFQDDKANSFDTTPVENDAGCVIVIAPWRQPIGQISCRTAAVYDCENELVYSLRPFDFCYIASTTKIMTMLLAYEASQLPVTDEDYISLEWPYTVLEWVTNDEEGVGGSSQVPLETFETLTYRSLLEVLLSTSGNDAAYAVADVVGENGVAGARAVPNFIARMQALAGEIGMNRTVFGNPCGRDPWNADDFPHYSCADDMVKLGRTAMQNAGFRALSTVQSWSVTREVVRDGDRVPLRATYYNGFLRDLRDLVASATGIKTGNTSGAGRCRVAASDLLGDEVFAGGFYWDTAIIRSSQTLREVAALLNCGYSTCEDQFLFIVPDLPAPKPYMYVRSISTAQDSLRGCAGSTEGQDDDSLSVDVRLEPSSGATCLGLSIRRHSLARLGAGEVADLALTPFAKHAGVRIENAGTNTATIQLNASHPAVIASYVLSPGSAVLLPAWTGTGTGSFTLAVQNISTGTITLEIQEQGYGFELSLAPPGADSFTALLTHGPLLQGQTLEVMTEGRDPAPGKEVGLAVHAPEVVVVGVDPAQEIDALPALSMLQATPNPFGGRVSFAFVLGRKADVALTVFDARGRRVVQTAQRAASPGRWGFEWNGRDESGALVSSGVYFYRIALDGHAAAGGKIVYVR